MRSHRFQPCSPGGDTASCMPRVPGQGSLLRRRSWGRVKPAPDLRFDAALDVTLSETQAPSFPSCFQKGRTLDSQRSRAPLRRILRAEVLQDGWMLLPGRGVVVKRCCDSRVRSVVTVRPSSRPDRTAGGGITVAKRFSTRSDPKRPRTTRERPVKTADSFRSRAPRRTNRIGSTTTAASRRIPTFSRNVGRSKRFPPPSAPPTRPNSPAPE